MRNLSQHFSVLEASLGTTCLVFLPQVALQGTVVYDEHLSFFFALGAMCLEWACVFAVVLLGLLGIRSKQRAVRVGSSLLFGGWLWLYLSSWGLFYGSEYFINIASLRMGGVSSTLLLKHFLEFSPAIFIATALLGPLIAGVLLCWSVRNRQTPERPRVRWSWIPLVVILTTAAGALGAAQISNQVVTDRKTAAVRLFPEYYSLVLRTKSGPALHLALDTFAPLAEGAWVLRGAPYPVTRLPRSAGKGYQASVPESARNYNVIILLVESMRRDVLQILGGDRAVMPHLEALARESQVFPRAYAQATHSDYADVTALSSQYPVRYRVHSAYFAPTPYPRILVHDVLGPRGYRTGIVSSQNEHWANMYDFLKTPALDHFFHSESHHDTYVPVDDGFADWAETWKRSGKLDDQTTIDEAIRWIGQSEKPFSLYMNLQNSHFPYRFPEGMPFQPSDVDFRFTFARYPQDKKHIAINRYHNALHYIDQQIGRLLDYLRNTGRLDKTVFLVSGDTGQAFYEHGFASHGQPAFEELAGIPLVIYVPGATPRIRDTLVSQVDYLPTLMSLLGMPAHPGHQGQSAFEMVEREGDEPTEAQGGAPRVVFTGRQLPGVDEIVVVRDHYKLFLLSDGSTLLFDLEKDPGERHNLSDKLPTIRDALRHTALSYRKAQLEYYSNEQRMAREYPPHLRLPEKLE